MNQNNVHDLLFVKYDSFLQCLDINRGFVFTEGTNLRLQELLNFRKHYGENISGTTFKYYYYKIYYHYKIIGELAQFLKFF